MDVVQCLVERYNADNATATARDNHIQASFWLACRYGQFPVVQYLIQEGGINVDMKNQGDGMTALLYASQYGAMPYVMFLCEACNADIHILDKLGESALDKATTYGHKEVATYISEQQKYMLKMTEQLRNAAKFGNLNAVIDCLSNHRRVNVNAGGSTGKTALHYAIANGHYGIALYLVRQCGANVNQCTLDGATPLHYACRYGHLKCVQFLCSNECPVPVDVHILDKQNETAFDKAKKYGRNDIIEFLEKAMIGSVSIIDNASIDASDATPRHSVENQVAEPIVVNTELILPQEKESIVSTKSKPLDPIREHLLLPNDDNRLNESNFDVS